MKTSIATVSLSGDLEEKLSAIAAAGFDGVEIFENDFLTFDGGPRDVGRMVSDLGLACVAFQPFRDFEGLPEPERARAFARAERKFDVMEELGTKLLLVCSNVSPVSLGGIDRAAADLRELGERAAKRGLTIGYEALAWGRHVSDHRDAWEIVRRADHPNVGLILDTYHTIARGVPVESIRSIPGDRIALVQVADAPKLDMDLLQLSRHFRCMPGQGDYPLVDFMQALDATGYDGMLSLEIFNDQFRAGSPRQTAADGKRGLVFLMDQVARSKTNPRGRKPAMPARPAPLGVEFIEFAVDEDTAAQLRGFLGGLGFHKAGTHRSKAVELWRQGAVNLVINSDKEGFAHSSYIVHGPSVCAIGLRVSDVEGAMARARELLVPSFTQAVGSGELEIPAIRGVGGSLIHFVEPTGPLADIWSVDFTLSDDTGGAGDIGLKRVDHIAQSMSYEEMLTWTLTYTALLDFEKEAQVDITDPGGLVRSQALHAPGGAVRVVLNSSQSAKTQSGRFLSEFFGAGTQHVAFESADIFATVRAMKANGLEPLPIPDNYYDDIDVRFGLDPALVAELRDHDVLYDRDGDGEYFQTYTRTFADRFFFEIVERRADGGRAYQGFGAANAPVRLAAQARSAPEPTVPRR
ncbi:4-hydroxyphenylpyruvate dioxygenase [Thalassobaculum fulvum]|uniref:3-dehydroshikimate dehydratase n=1 Tax=Thalassobaculum fulvum TaxID=1633335 RepID=A0A918XXX6_9PROT|nr:sugar phosphate isomerase/epimerase and 4-hydroxyphenylpyruvate domain-containing protein [Thalassobaculum fulvum]GHD62058.1 4-hydroxyphenylpyruvate dioxygenase [Thalassobaculum fulvum]